MINQSNLKKIIDSADNVLIGMDYLRINIKNPISFLSTILHRLDTDNSNIHLETIGNYEVSMTKLYTRGGGSCLNISISIENVPYTIFQYLEYSQKSKKILKSTGGFVYYGTYFRLLEIGKLSQLFEQVFFGNYYYNFSQEDISRVDYKIDLFYKRETVIIGLDDVLNKRKDVKTEIYSMEEGEYLKHRANVSFLQDLECPKPVNYNIQNEYLKWNWKTGRNYGNKANKSIFIRMYEKLVDTLAKWKVMLYDDYFKYKNVYRFEIEFRTKFNKKKLSDGVFRTYLLWELPELEEKIHKFFGFIESDIKQKFLYQYDKNTTTDFSEVSKYQKDFGGRWYRLAIEGNNPFEVLYKVLSKKLNIKLLDRLINEFKGFMSKKDHIHGPGD